MRAKKMLPNKERDIGMGITSYILCRQRAKDICDHKSGRNAELFNDAHDTAVCYD